MSRLFAPPKPQWPWRILTPHGLAILVTVLVTVAAALHWIGDQRTCAPGVMRRGPECIGVTDGSHHFEKEDLAGVLGKIKTENDLVERGSEPYVSIAYLVSLSQDERDKAAAEGLRHQLQGAHLAQLRANRTETLGDLPKIRLLVANAGKHNNHQKPVVEQLLGMTGAPDRLVAVAGLGQSRAATQEMILALAGKLPMIAATLTADDFNPDENETKIDGFARVSFLDRDQAVAAATYLKSQGFRKWLLIQDTNSKDTYAISLSQAFKNAYTKALSVEHYDSTLSVEHYDSSKDGVATVFAVKMSGLVCLQQPDVIYFAGRGSELRSFIEALSERSCKGSPITIVTGDSGVSIANDIQLSKDPQGPQLRWAPQDNLILRYTALAHPRAWEDAPGLFQFTNFKGCHEPPCFMTLFDGESLDDGAAIMGHDAVLTAVKAIRFAATGDENRLPTASAVIQGLNHINKSNVLLGASGCISLADGNPANKVIPILELKPDGSVSFVQLVASASPECGAPHQ
jgi:ABC-type branched-subunit amino acid transport system substrate-binding protein